MLQIIIIKKEHLKKVIMLMVDKSLFMVTSKTFHNDPKQYVGSIWTLKISKKGPG